MERMGDDEADRTRSRSARPADESASDQADGQAGEDEEIRRRAFERYQARGDGPGSDVDDWLEAERELRGQDESGLT